MTSNHYDLIVIGSGPAGEKGAAQAAYFGKRVALIEKEKRLGGAAANTGTLPSKTLRESAVFLSGFKHRQLDGLDFRGLKERVTIRDFMAREQLIADWERTRIRQNMDRHHVTLVQGAASFIDSHTVAVEITTDEERAPRVSGGSTATSPRSREGLADANDTTATLLSADVMLIATGSYPHRPSQFDFSDPRLFESDSILRLHELPASMLVVGGGVIGCEYACIFAVLGIKVTLVEKRRRLLDFLDGEMALALQEQMHALGIRVILNDSIDSIDYGTRRSREDELQVKLQSGTLVSANVILVSSGRCGQTEQLGLDRLGVEVEARGRIKVNARYQTNVPHIYAAGDVIGFPALAASAMEQARVAMVHAFQLAYMPGGTKEALAPVLPYGIYTIPECSLAGETEESLQEKKIPYVVGKALYSQNARGQIIGDSGGFLKLLFHMDDLRLLGVHVLGEQATEIVHVGLSALLMNAGAHLFIQSCYNYPTLTELYKYATYDALGQRAKLAGRAP